MPKFEFEIYWGTPSGTLMHDTIVVEAADFADAESQVYRNRPVPKPGFEACAKQIYADGYYDIEYLGELVSE